MIGPVRRRPAGDPRFPSGQPIPRGGLDVDTEEDLGGSPRLSPPLGGDGPKPGERGGESDEGRFGEGPRERPRPPVPPGGPAPPQLPPQPTPAPPREPTPSGGVMPPPPMSPFPPMAQPNPASLIEPAGAGPSRRQFGGAYGLTGGGFGMSDPTSNQTSDPIQSLIQSLLQKRGSFGAF
jgi:hypothetical protein